MERRLSIRNELDQPINDRVLHTVPQQFYRGFWLGKWHWSIPNTPRLMPTAKKKIITLIGNRQAERVPFSLAEGASVTVYGKMRVVNEKEPFIWVQLSKEDYFKNWRFIEKTRVEWASIGSLLTFILFSILLYFTTRDRVFLWHSLYLSGIFLYLLEFFNVLPDLVWMRDHRIFSQVFIYATLCLMDVAYIQFIRQFMDMKKNRPVWDRRFHWFAVARIVFAGLVILFYLATFNMKRSDDVTAFFLVMEYVGMIGLLLWLFGWKDKQSRFLIAGTAIFVVAIVVNAFSVVAGIGLIFSFTQFGVVGEAILFTIALGYRMRRMAKEQQEANRLKDLDEFKSRFYTNVTHEFRTPLTVIMGNTEIGKGEVQNLEETPTSYSSKTKVLLSNFDTIARNASQLLRLINRLLDLSKLQSGKMPLQLKQGDIISYLKYLVESFHSYAASREINVRFLCELEQFEMDFDAEKMQDILSNLLSNAIKFSPPYSEVIVTVKAVFLEKQSTEQLQVSIKNSGEGIPLEALPFIFDRFSTAKDTGNPAGGSGVGLALTKELVELMGGRIRVKSELGQGATFTFTLPVSREASKMEQSTSELFPVEHGAVDGANLPLPVPNNEEEKPVCLVIDDNADIVRYLQNLLANEYEVIVAFDGQQGIEKALEQLPDVIISDVMMPEKDGLEVCDFLKNDERTSHIPIILLTAKATVQDRIEGLRRGADAYLQKPFNREELFISLKKSVELRNRLISYFSRIPKEVQLPDSTEPEFVIENSFLQKARKIVEENLADDKFDIHHLCRELALSRAQLHRKLTALTGKSASHFIRSIRLATAKEMLAKTALTISEIAYDVGFKDPNYFSRTFAEEFGMPPSETRK
ncbi:MAG: ATP-binding protein [Saprospiraceae bacterium]